MYGRTYSVGQYRFGYQSSEKDDEVSGNGNSYSTFFRQLDTRLGRWFSIDPNANPTESPFVMMGNNPIYNTDVQGDSIDPKQLVEKSKASYNKIITELEKQTGLKFILDKNGNMNYEKDKRGRAIVSRDENGNKIGSRLARRFVKRMINRKKVVKIKYSKTDNATKMTTKKDREYKGHTANIWISDVQIEQLIANANNLEDGITGWGFVFLHELYHSKSRYNDDGDEDSYDRYTGPTVRFVNRIRKQLNYKNIRVCYLVALRGKAYMVFDKNTQKQLRNGVVPKNGKYTWLKQVPNKKKKGMRNRGEKL